MNILIISESFYPRVRGGEVVLLRISKELVRKGNKVYVITSRLIKTQKYENYKGIDIYRPYYASHVGRTNNIKELYYKIIFNRKISKYLYNFLIYHSIDIIYNQAYPLTVATSRVAGKLGIPFIISVGSYQKKINLHIKTVFLDIFHFIKQFIVLKYCKYDSIRCGSKYIKNKISKYTNKKIYTIPTPIEKKIIKRIIEKTDVDEVRIKYNIKYDELFILFVGALVQVKNVVGLINALGGLSRKFKLIIVGNGPERKNIKEKIEKYHLEKKVFFAGTKKNNETLTIIKACDVLIVPSHLETCGNVIIEALSLERPVISKKVGIACEIDSENLYLVDHIDDARNILEKKLLPKRDDIIINEYSVDRIVKKYESMFKDIIYNLNYSSEF